MPANGTCLARDRKAMSAKTSSSWPGTIRAGVEFYRFAARHCARPDYAELFRQMQRAKELALRWLDGMDPAQLRDAPASGTQAYTALRAALRAEPNAFDFGRLLPVEDALYRGLAGLGRPVEASLEDAPCGYCTRQALDRMRALHEARERHDAA